MKRAISLLLIMCLLFTGMFFISDVSSESNLASNKEYFDFVEIQKTIDYYFKSLHTGNKEDILKVVGKEYFNFVKEGKADLLIKKIKDFGKVIRFSTSSIKVDEENNIVIYRAGIEYSNVCSLNTLIIKELKDGPKIIDHRIVVFIPQDKK